MMDIPKIQKIFSVPDVKHGLSLFAQNEINAIERLIIEQDGKFSIKRGRGVITVCNTRAIHGGPGGFAKTAGIPVFRSRTHVEQFCCLPSPLRLIRKTPIR